MLQIVFKVPENTIMLNNQFNGIKIATGTL